MKKFIVVIPLLLVTLFSIEAMVLDNFHCKVATCREFYYVSALFFDYMNQIYTLKLLKGFKNVPRHQDYVDTCYETVSALQSIPRKYGKCLDDSTMKLNPACIRKFFLRLK
jgi:hypothetical protein